MGNARPIFKPYVLLALTCVISPLVTFSQSQNKDLDVNAIFLPVVVAGKDGKYVTDLKESDFQVFEDKIPQRITKVFTPNDPFSVVVALDCSGTSRPNLKKVQNKAMDLMNSLRPRDSITILSFGKQVRILRELSADRAGLASTISSIAALGRTALYNAVGFALETLLNPVQGRTALVLFTDGFDNASDRYGREKTLELARASRTVIYCMYDGASEEVLQNLNAPIFKINEGRICAETLSGCTGGRKFDFAQTTELIQELANHYTLSYLPARTNGDGKIHKIEVKVSRAEVKIRSRKEYFAPRIPKS